MVELSDTDIKVAITNVLLMFQENRGNMNMLRKVEFIYKKRPK